MWQHITHDRKRKFLEQKFASEKAKWNEQQQQQQLLALSWLKAKRTSERDGKGKNCAQQVDWIRCWCD